MRFAWAFLMVHMTLCCLFAELHAQYFGGNGDGYTTLESPDLSLDDSNIYAGGSGDGYAMASSPAGPLSATSPLPHDFLFLAEDEVNRDKLEFSAGDIHSNNDISFDKGQPDQTDHVGNITAVNEFKLRKRNLVEGDVAAGDLDMSSKAVVTGTAEDNASVTVVPLPVLTPFAANNDDREVDKDETLALAPGTYGDLEVNKRSTVQLTHDGNSGEYFFGTADFGKKTVLEIDVSSGPVVINVVDEFEFGGGSKMVLLPNGEDDSELVTLNYLGDKKVDIDEEVDFFATIVAPAAEVSFGEDSFFRGAICAYFIQLHDGGTFLHHGASSAPAPLAKSANPSSLTFENPDLPTSFALQQNYPNPFNPTTTINFSVPEAGAVTLTIYNLRGQLVQTLISDDRAAGAYSVVWSGRDATGAQVASGLYLYRLQAGEFVSVRKMMFMK